MNVLLVASVAPIVRDPGPSAHLARRGSRPQASIEFEVDDVAGAATELEAAGHRLIHGAKTEPWGQEIARLLSPEGLLVGVCHTPWLHG